jgi:hypothetical protein
MCRDRLIMLEKESVINGLGVKVQSFVKQFCSLIPGLHKGIIEMSTGNSIIPDFYRSAEPNMPGIFSCHEVRSLCRVRKKILPPGQ